MSLKSFKSLPLCSEVSGGVKERTEGADAEHCPGGLLFKAHRLCVSLNSRIESNKEEEKKETAPAGTIVPCLLFFFFCITLKPRVEGYTKSMSLKYEPASEPPHISVK